MFEGKVALVTGSSQGIGQVIATKFAEYGADVVVHGLGATDDCKTCQDIRAMGRKTAAYDVDITNVEAVNEMVKDIIAKFGKIDILINNAGIAQQKLFTDITNEDWNAMVGVNLSGVFYCCRAALPYLIRQKAGSIVNVSSMWGICGASCEVHYSAVKAGVIGLTKALAKEVGPSGIRVNCIAPGAIATRMNDNLDEEAVALLREETPLGRMGTPEEIAKAIAFLALEDSAFTTGQVLSPNGGLVI